jgi:hypothetical protein
VPAGRNAYIPDAIFLIRPALRVRAWLASSASLGSSLSVGINACEYFKAKLLIISTFPVLF